MLDLASFHEMESKNFRLTCDPLGKASLHGLCNARMQLLPIAAQKRAVGGVLHQSVLECVNGLRRQPALEYQFRSDKPGQFVLQPPLGSTGDGTEQLIGKLTAYGGSGLRHLSGGWSKPIEPRHEGRLQRRGQSKR